MPVIASKLDKNISDKSLHCHQNVLNNNLRFSFLKKIKNLMIFNDKNLSEKFTKNILVLSSSRRKEYGSSCKSKIEINSSRLFDQTLEEYKNKMNNGGNQYLQFANVDVENMSMESIEYSNKIKYNVEANQRANRLSKVEFGESCEITQPSEIVQNFNINYQETFSSIISDENSQTKKTNTLKKLVSIFSNKHTLLKDVKTQVIDILDPENKISGRQRLKSLNLLLNNKTIDSIIDINDVTNSEYSNYLSRDSSLEDEDLKTQLALEYTFFLINQTYNLQMRTSSGTILPAFSRNPELMPSFGGIDGCIDINYKRAPRHSNVKTNNGRESFNALSHMFTLKKLLGFDHAIRHSVIKRFDSYQYMEDDTSSWSDGNEDSVDKTLIHIFSQKILKEINIKNTIGRLS